MGKYVGQGAGDFEVVSVPTNFRTNVCLCIIPLLLLLLLVPLLMYLLPQLSSAPETTTFPPTPPAPPTTAEPYDCKSQGLWSFDQKGWCCEHYGVGCPTTPPATPAPPPPSASKHHVTMPVRLQRWVQRVAAPVGQGLDWCQK